MENNKNIWLLPTNEPSMFHTWINEKGLRATLYEKPQLEVPNTAKNIYITSDEEITSNCWAFNVATNTLYKTYGGKGFNEKDEKNDWRKVILTTEKLLIKDGVQSIDDEFLEWFVKNPSCESVEVYQFGFEDSIIKHPKKWYIEIPQEEPKQETLSWDELVQEAESKEELIKILKLPHIAPLVREAMRNNCKK
jgi:hypothetical protein